jgi:hypothetical protein
MDRQPSYQSDLTAGLHSRLCISSEDDSSTASQKFFINVRFPVNLWQILRYHISGP